MQVIPGYEDYSIDKEGNLFSHKVNRFLKPGVTSGGYLRTRLINSNGMRTFSIHRLVALTYIGKSDLEINHIDGDKTNNSLSNLEYCTRSYNVESAYKLGLKSAPSSMKIIAETLMGDRMEFKSVREAARFLNIAHSSILALLKNKVRKTRCNIKFKYAEI